MTSWLENKAKPHQQQSCIRQPCPFQERSAEDAQEQGNCHKQQGICGIAFLVVPLMEEGCTCCPFCLCHAWLVVTSAS